VAQWEVLALAAAAALLEVLALAGLRRLHLSPAAPETRAALFAPVGLWHPAAHRHLAG